MNHARGTDWLIVRAGTRRCAIALADVGETMRPQPITTLPGVPSTVLGSAVIRGGVVPVVHAGALLGESLTKPSRFVTIKVERRSVALAVDDVIGLRQTATALEAAMPPLLVGAEAHAVSALGVADRELVLVLEGIRLVPQDIWSAIEQ